MNDLAKLPWLAGLNPPQLEAASYEGGPLLILAGAGSGKTRAIVHRIAHLIRGRGVDPRSILAVTFTNKAAQEMQNRVIGLLEDDSAGVWVSTFHRFSAQVLRRHIERLGYGRAFVIFDDSDQNSLLKKIIKSHGYDPKVLTPRELKSWIDKVKREALTAAQIEDDPHPNSRRNLALLKDYQQRLIDSNALDFGDLLLLTYRLFELHPEVLEEYHRRFQHFLVDEYQDTNQIQYLLVKMLVGGSGDVCVVGDEDQSIYGWRGANIENILNFEKDFPHARVIFLEQNYRSTQTVIEAAGEVIGHNRERKPKKLWTDNPAGNPIKLLLAEDERGEAAWVIEEVMREKSNGRRLGDMAVFYRTHAQSRVFEDQLRGFNLAYTVYGGPRFYDRMEVKDVLAYLRFLVNPHDEVSLLRIINNPSRGIGARTVARVEEIKQESGSDWIESLRAGAEDPSLTAKSKGGLRAFVRLFDELSPLLQGAPSVLADEVIDKSGYRAMLEKEPGIEARARVENLEELVNAVTEHELQSEDPTLLGFLEKVSLAQDMDRFDLEGGTLTLMTIHSAKGLEFPLVFIVGMEDGVFPHQRSLAETGDDGRALEEERRLCYVGMTRAREQLILTQAASRAARGYRQRSEPSQFLAEIPESCLQRVFKGGVRAPRLREPAATIAAAPSRQDFGDSEIVYDQDREDSSWTSPDGFSLKVGDRVRHPTYGVGVIKRYEETGEKLKVLVKFPQGTKKFLAKFANLSPA